MIKFEARKLIGGKLDLISTRANCELCGLIVSSSIGNRRTRAARKGWNFNEVLRVRPLKFPGRPTVTRLMRRQLLCRRLCSRHIWSAGGEEGKKSRWSRARRSRGQELASIGSTPIVLPADAPELSIITRIKRRTSPTHSRYFGALFPGAVRDHFDISSLAFSLPLSLSHGTLFRRLRIVGDYFVAYSNSNNLRIHRHLVRANMVPAFLRPTPCVLQLRGLQTTPPSRFDLYRARFTCILRCTDLISTLRISLLDSGSVDKTYV